MNFASVLQGFVAVLWIITIGLLVLTVVRASRGYKVRALSIGVLVTSILAVVLTTISAGLVFIQPEERGVVISAIADEGYRQEPLQPGLNWIIPYFESVTRYPIARQTYTMSIAPGEGQVQGDDSVAGRTSDGQEIFLDASVIYAIDPDQVVKVHIDWQNRYTQELVRPLSRGVTSRRERTFGGRSTADHRKYLTILEWADTQIALWNDAEWQSAVHGVAQTRSKLWDYKELTRLTRLSCRMSRWESMRKLPDGFRSGTPKRATNRNFAGCTPCDRTRIGR